MHSTDLVLRRAADAIDSMDDAFAAVDHEWRIVLVNQQHEMLFARPRRESIGQSFWRLFPEGPRQPRFLAEIRRAADDRVTVSFEEYCEPLGRWLEGRACPNDGGLDVYLRDVTARKRSDAERPATRRCDEILGIVAHDLRNHLNTIRASSKVALVLGDRAPRRPIETIMRASERMDRLIRDLLDVTAIESGKLAFDPGPVRPIDLLSEAVDAHAAACAELGIDLAVECARDLPEVAADVERLLQILGNLIGNAMKFTPRGGRVALGAEIGTDHIRFWVADTGQGVAAELLPTIFDKFRQRRSRPQEGAGLGLAICKAIVDAHDGRIWVESDPGAGTTVAFTMPLCASEQARPSRIAPACTPACGVRQPKASEESC
jgi:signal transduction histidine kinase